MKFAKELEREAVPEWRIKYLNYKAGKKYVKAAARAYNRANATPRSSRLEPTARTPRSHRLDRTSTDGDFHAFRRGHSFSERDPKSPRQGAEPIPVSRSGEQDALTNDGQRLQYGSFIATPPASSPAKDDSGKAARDFQLPDPAMPSPGATTDRPAHLKGILKRAGPPTDGSMRRSTSLAVVPSAEDGPHKALHASSLRESPSQLKRLFSHSPGLTRAPTRNSEMSMRPLDLVRERERQFHDFLDSELEKVESFYKLKEEQAGNRLQILRQQLHEMRNRRIVEMSQPRSEDHALDAHTAEHDQAHHGGGWVQPIKAKIFPPGPNSKAFQSMIRTPRLSGHERDQPDASRDYSRRPEDDEVSYRTAKRKLKLALQEFYRGLELLKSYSLLNRTAFRKLNKKFDKAVNARPTYRYMTDKVNKAWFVESDVLDGHIKAVEDLYARYFERGNHKLAVGKLRSLTKTSRDESGSSFLCGLLIGTGAVFTVQGTVYGAQLLFHDDATIRLQTSYLLQLYGGYFLMLVMFSLFVIDCFLWTRNKINYPFIFEFDMRHHIDWRILAEFPSFFLFLFGILIWANFSRYGSEDWYLYYPVILIGLTILFIFMPLPVGSYKSRQWFVYSHWRLFLAGIYPVEFRDFFLGDMYCSLTYATSNIELFFCLYGTGWSNPVQCNSNHSRALGFLSTLPPIWRFLQCIRRYRDTRNVFPHLVNCGKYSMTILSYIFLSLYRINNTHGNLALFITFSIINGIYTSIWDLFMDFSLLQSQSRHRFLRDILALKSRWPYYTIMVVDPILRFSWIFYAIFTHNAQHSTIVSFLVSLTEVTRRGMWALFRVENEHCSNVSQYKASRDVPLPYRIEPLMGRASADTSPTLAAHQRGDMSTRPATIEDAEGGGAADTTAASGTSTSIHHHHAVAPENTIRRRRDQQQSFTGTKWFSRLLAEAHKQDFEKRKKPVDQDVEEEEARQGHASDDDDDESQSGGDESDGVAASGSAQNSTEDEDGSRALNESETLEAAALVRRAQR